MFNTSVNISSQGEDLKLIATILTIITIAFASLNVLSCTAIVLRLVYYAKCQKYNAKHSVRRVGILHSINTFIHIDGQCLVVLIMASRTLYSDFYMVEKEINSPPSWHCRLLNYFVSMFAAGIYGTCFLQALFRFWRIMRPHRRIYYKFKFHCQLVVLHWILIIIISIPVWFRSIYLSSENYCLNRFSDTWASIYISITSVVTPVSGIIIVYLKIVVYMNNVWQTRKRWRRMKRDRLMIKRMLLLVFVLSSTSSAAVLLWLLMFIQQRLHPLSYRLLCLIIQIGMLMCIITLLLVSPPLRRALLTTKTRQHRKKQDTNSSSDNSNPKPDCHGIMETHAEFLSS
ncbi:unnamed protein product [Adineta ricciae]|uniref:G-protein coupled receptors family 1 profile domain-containing protein n=1 Tax=Adineta ricciae TaxID=249248 RepID=A0A814UVL7_ADIRI|nr:unnamed protein product [Adineta ricciae]CAF1213516.1 unnamed protein product [Adineta ricciae]